MVGLLLLIGFLWLIGYLAKRSDYSKSASVRQTEEDILRRRNREWVQFILGYRNVAQTESEKRLMNRIVGDMQSQGLVDESDIDSSKDSYVTIANPQSSIMPSAVATTVEPHTSVTSDIEEFASRPKDDHRVRLDNISLLLYFGAFLFIASVGLFVAFAGVSGWVRTLAVLFVALALYGAGQWVYKSKPALKPAGLAFVGIGVAIAPLVGVAGYNYIISVSTEVVWFATSIFCMALYGHAVFTIRKPLINYVFIFTLLSLFESGVAMFDAPIYYFGWAMATVGLLLQFLGSWKDTWPDFRESSKAGSQLYIPLAILVSLAIIPTQGYGQLGISLLLASLYYGLEAWNSVKTENRSAYALTSHISLLAGLLSLFYGNTNNVTITGIFLVVLSAVHIIVLMIRGHRSKIMQNFASIMLISSIASLLFLVGQWHIITVVIGLIIGQSLFVWWHQKRTDAYVLAVLSWSAMPLVFGALALRPKLSIDLLAALSIIALIIHIGMYLLVFRPHILDGLLETAKSTVLIHIAVVAGTILFASPSTALVALFATSLVLLALSIFDKDNIWEIVSGIVISLAVVRCWNDILLLSAIMVALAYNILLALRFRSEANRWISTGLWLLWPIGLGGLTTSQHWIASQYAWAYMVVMIGLVISRAIARGVVFPSAKIPMATYIRTASLSYVYGYVVAGSLAVIISLFSPDSRAHTTVILGALSAIVFVLAWSIEKAATLVALQPILWQFMLISGLRPASEGDMFIFFVVASTLLAIVCYGGYRLLEQDDQANKLIPHEFGQSAVVASIIAPSSVLYASEPSWVMPAGLFATGLILIDYWRAQAQEMKELAIGVLVVAFMWLLHYFGIREAQAYTHILALMFAGFAWWRHELHDKENGDNYIHIALATATIPLLLQALSGTSGDIYGWWLLLEQIVIMLIGMAIRKHFVTMWGLYVAIGSVLYQLRHLGYAALAVLAIFVIGIAVYQLQRYNKPDQ